MALRIRQRTPTSFFFCRPPIGAREANKRIVVSTSSQARITMSTIISDISAALAEIRKTAASLVRTTAKAKGDVGIGDGRFFERPMDSVARTAKKSILYFPIVTSESMDSETVGMLAKAVQVRAAEYVRLMIANMDPLQSEVEGKATIVSALRGATLKDALVSESAAVSAYVRTHAARLCAENGYPEDALRPPLEVFSESRRRAQGGGPDQDEMAEILGVSGGRGDQLRAERLAAAAAAAASYNNTNSSPPSSGPSLDDQRVELQASRNELEQKAREVERMRQEVEARAAEATSRDAASQAALKQAEEALKRAQEAEAKAEEKLQRRQEILGQAEKYANSEAEKRIAAARLSAEEREAIRLQGAKDIEAVKTQGDADRRAARAKDDADRLTRETQEALKRDAEERAQKVSDVIRLAKEGTPLANAKAVQLVRDILSTNDGEGLGRLRQNASAARIVSMVEKYPLEEPITLPTNKVESNWSAKDYDKINGSLPLILTLTVQQQTMAGIFQTPLSLGIKAIAHVVPSLDIVTALGTALQRNNLFLQFLRLTSGEISFIKDFVLNLNVAKMRASSRTTSGTKVFETLRRQAEWNQRRSNVAIASVTTRGFVPPTTTLAITADEADRIRSVYGVDFTKPATVRELLKIHNLMGFMIVDEAIGLIRVFEDGDDDFDRVPFSEMKARGKETSVKDVMTILARK